jgi:hypothetical protein
VSDTTKLLNTENDIPIAIIKKAIYKLGAGVRKNRKTMKGNRKAYADAMLILEPRINSTTRNSVPRSRFTFRAFLNKID